MGGAAVVAGLAGLVIMVVSAQTLDPVANAEFMVFWSLLFWIIGALSGIQVETVRTVRRAALDRADVDRLAAANPHHRPGVKVVPWGVGFGLVLASAVTALAWLFDRPAFAGSGALSALALIIGSSLFAGQAAFAGAAGGKGRWRWAAVMGGGEGVVRLVAFAIVLMAIDGQRFIAFKLAAAAGGLICLAALLPAPGARLARRARGELPAAGYLAKTGQAVAAGAASSSLINGFAALMSLTMDNQTVRGAAGLMFAVTMVRAPFLVALNAFMPMIVARLIDAGPRAGRLVALGAAGLALAAGLGAGVVGLVGPWLLSYFNVAYQLSALVLAVLTVGAACLAAVALSGSWALARGQHGAYLAGWLTALGVAAAVLAAPLSATVAVCVALIAGPLAGTAVHLTLIALRRPAR
jgi:hypothetical protein